MSNPQVVDMFGQQMDVQIEMNQNMLHMISNNPDYDLQGATREDIQYNLDNAKLLKTLYAKDKEAFKKKYVEVNAAAGVKTDMNSEKQREMKERKQIAEVENYIPIIKNELQQFLNQSANIDFNAQLVKKGDRMVFVNPAYEAKANDWKFYFRCGKEAVSGARKFAEEWLNSIHE